MTDERPSAGRATTVTVPGAANSSTDREVLGNARRSSTRAILSSSSLETMRGAAIGSIDAPGEEIGAGLSDTDPPLPGELIYEYTPRVTQTIEYGVSAAAMFAGAAPPPEGARFDLYLEGPVCAGKLVGTVRGVDYLNFRADGRVELHIHAEIRTQGGHNVALEAGGIAIRRDGSSLLELREHVSLRSNHAELAWVNGVEIWAGGVVDVASGRVHLRAFSG